MNKENLQVSMLREKPVFKERSFNLGVVTSVLWVIAMAALTIWKRGDLAGLELNQWGDFFAGAFAPLAFLWLALGYLQQGEELRMSTMALHLQAEELQKSAEQQRQLVEVTREQLESERAAREFELRQREAELSPIIEVQCNGGSFSGHITRYNVQVINTGYLAASFKARVIAPDEQSTLVLNEPLLERGAIGRCSFEVGSPITGERYGLFLSFRDATGAWRTQTYTIFRDESDPKSLIQFRSVAHSIGKTPPPGEVQ